MFSYDTALNLSFNVSLASGVILICLILYQNCLAIFFPPVLFIYIVICSSLTSSLFLVIYPLANIAFQFGTFFKIEFIQGEYSNGILLLRIVSVIIGYRALSSVKHMVAVAIAGIDAKIKISEWRQLPKSSRETIYFLFKEKYEYKEMYSLDYAKSKTQHEWEYLTQFGIYLFTIIAIGAFIYHGNNNIYVTLLIASLFFIADDWNIIYDYSKETKGRILKMHKARIDIFNIIIFILFVIAVSDRTEILKSLLFVCSFLFIYFGRYINLFDKRAKLVGN